MHALVVDNLTKIYPKNLIALKGVGLTVEKGEFFALLGPNGAGKSTFIGILCSLVNKTSGRVRVFGHDLDTDPEGVKSCIGVVPQEFNFNPFEKIMQIVVNQAGYYGIRRPAAIERAEYYLNKLGLWKKRHENALRLSGGMKRRLMIVRALINDPSLLVLDEPTAGVDIELRHALWEFLAALNAAGTTIILTTHYLEEAEHLCRRVAIIDHGEIIEDAGMKSLIARLHLQTLVLDLAHPVNDLPPLPDYPCRLLDNMTLEVELRRHQTLNDLFAALSRTPLQITGMRNKTGRLEELFVHLTQKDKSPS